MGFVFIIMCILFPSLFGMFCFVHTHTHTQAMRISGWLSLYRIKVCAQICRRSLSVVVCLRLKLMGNYTAIVSLTLPKHNLDRQ